MSLVSVLPHAEFGPNDHRTDSPHFIGPIRVSRKLAWEDFRCRLHRFFVLNVLNNLVHYSRVQYKSILHFWNKEINVEIRSNKGQFRVQEKMIFSDQLELTFLRALNPTVKWGASYTYYLRSHSIKQYEEYKNSWNNINLVQIQEKLFILI